MIKPKKYFVFFIPILLSFLVLMSFNNLKKGEKETKRRSASIEDEVKGAWRLVSTGVSDEAKMTVIKIITDVYYTYASYNEDDPEFIGTGGGTYDIDENNNFSENVEFFTWDSSRVGTTNFFEVKIEDGKMHHSGERDGEPFEEVWERVDGFDEEEAPLAGTWRIRQRQREPGEMSTMEWGPRKTLKILSNKRIQWIAYNAETGQFSGTGGGTYSSEDGKYIEKLEFFSRDPKRVGAELSFEFEKEGNNWHHRGKSSTGNEIYEVWEKVE
ncbi:hypothetical protein BH23BAC1_BH23BAC1_23120 [soil metagenome]